MAGYKSVALLLVWEFCVLSSLLSIDMTWVESSCGKQAQPVWAAQAGRSMEADEARHGHWAAVAQAVGAGRVDSSD